MTVTTLSLPSSPPPPSPKKHKSSYDDPLDLQHLGLMPIELCNGCSEKDCSIESDDNHLTNAVRRHFLEHFGHRDLEATIADYSETGIMVCVVNGQRKSYHGKSEIREACADLFKMIPAVSSTFSLQNLTVHDNNVMVVWSAQTPKHSFPHSSDVLLFDRNRKICKQFLNCQSKELETPWYVDDN
jgi:ketosteroid isomerase-like protein